MQLRYAVLAIAAVLACSNVPAVACPLKTVSPLPAQVTFGRHFLTGTEDDESVPSQIRQQAAALAHTASEVTAFSTEAEDESFSPHVRELADTAARREIIAIMEAIDKTSDVSELRSFLIDVEEESLSSYFRELADAGSLPNRALQAVEVRADREIGRAAPASWSNDDDFPGAEEQDATGSTSAVPLTESIALEGHEDR